MKLIIQDNKIIGTIEGNVVHSWQKLDNYEVIDAPSSLDKRLQDTDDPLHASHLLVQNGKVVAPKTIAPANSDSV